MDDATLRRLFRGLNKHFMVPLLKNGFGPWVGSPYGGYIMMLEMIGHKTGLTRQVPVNYALHGGHIYCVSGFGAISHWYKNLQANPAVTVILPGRTVQGTAVTVSDEAEWLPMLRQVLKNSGLAAFLAGINPFTETDAGLQEKCGHYQLLRIETETPVSPTAYDPGGWFWLAPVGLTLLAGLLWGRRRKLAD